MRAGLLVWLWGLVLVPTGAAQGGWLAGDRASAAQGGSPALVYASDPEAGPPIEVALERLLGDGTRLDGRYVRAYSDVLDDPGGARGRDASTDFRFEPAAPGDMACTLTLSDCSRFDAVNAYYHTDRVATVFWRDRMGIDPMFQAEVVTHVSGDGAFADPARYLIKLGVGSIFMQNAALEDEIIYHEFVHLMGRQLGYVLDTSTPVQGFAIGEGYADYLAATFTGNPRIGAWIVTCPDRQMCQGPPDDLELRTLASDPAVWNWSNGNPSPELKYGICTRYHEGDGKCKTSWNNFVPRYTWAMIWGSLLWDLREELGPDVADRLAVEAMSSGDASTETMEVAAGRLVEADYTLFAGVHAGMIQEAAGRRGILAASTLREASPRGGPPREMAAYPVPGARQVRIQTVLPGPTRMLVRAFDASGRLHEVVFEGAGTTGSNTLTWDVSRVPPGMYFVRLDTPGAPPRVAPVLVAR